MISRRVVLSGIALGASGKVSFAVPQPKKVQKLLTAARGQIGITTLYDPAYVRLSFPGGDVARERGVCTDVVVRAYRDAFGIDLQKLLNVDMKKHFSLYPTRWGLKQPDRNIDHRRVPNLQVYFTRHGNALSVSKKPDDYQPGDLVTMNLPGNLPHICIVSDERTEVGVPLVIHNIGQGTVTQDILFSFDISGHYRYALD